MTKPDARTLMVRSLNETRLLHPPTYVALRLLADSIASEATSGWTPEAVLRKFPLQRTPRLFEIVRLKKALPGQQLEYRHYLIPSPMTSLAEAITLSELATTAPFRKSNRVFSHPWPRSPDYPYNFRYFMSGYKRRNRAIAAAFRRYPARIAVVTERPLKGSVLFRARPERCRCTDTRYSWDAIASHHSSFQRTWYSHRP